VNQSIKRFILPSLAALGAITLAVSIMAPAAAQTAAPMASGAPPQGTGQCAGDHNLMRVHRRLLGAITQLSNDQKDYGGHRVAALNDLQSARTEIVAAESYAQTSYQEPAHCFNVSNVAYGGNPQSGERNQGNSNNNLASVNKWVGGMITHLQADPRDYGGHRDAAIKDMQQAQSELAAGASSAT
jgi:hypothetical protein